MRQADQAALLADAARGFGGRQTGRYGLCQVQPNQVALGRANLLADDDRQLGRGGVADSQRAVDALVIGYR